jgi:nucleoside-diphosphate-sugar epimerase
MANVFVTGASGFIGARLVCELIKRGHVVHALTHRTKLESPPGLPPDEQCDFNHPNIRLFPGDLSDSHDYEGLKRAMDGCTHVYHLAGYAKSWSSDQHTYLKTNVSGLCRVCDMALKLGVERMVWTSTMLTFGPTPRGTVGDESMPRPVPFKCFTDYESSKLAAESYAARYVEDGLPLVTVNPTRVFGPGHLNESNSVSQLMDMYDRGRLPFLLGGGRNVGNWVYVDDVVQGLILAMENGRVGEKYILGGENLSLKDFFKLVSQVSGNRHFQITIRRPAALTYAWLQKKRAERFGIYPQITPEWVRVFLTDWAYSSAKAQQELGYQITPLEEAVRRTYQWMVRVRSESNSR